MNRIRFGLAAAAAAALALAVAGTATAAATPLVATVGPGFTITLKKGSQKVTSLPAGAYKITVQDKSTFHNFHLTGPGVSKLTAVGKTGTTIWRVTLKKGTYKYVCDPHKAGMKGSFTVR